MVEANRVPMAIYIKLTALQFVSIMKGGITGVPASVTPRKGTRAFPIWLPIQVPNANPMAMITICSNDTKATSCVTERPRLLRLAKTSLLCCADT